MIGVEGPPRRLLNSDVFCLRRLGSDEGIRVVPLPFALFIERGVTDITGDFPLPVSLRANFRKGDIDLDIVLAEVGVREVREPLGGVARYPLWVDAVPTDS